MKAIPTEYSSSKIRSVSQAVVCPCLSYVSHGHFHISCRNLLHCLNKEQLFRLIHNVCPWHWKTPNVFETLKRCTRKELLAFSFFKVELIKHCLRVYNTINTIYCLYRSKFCWAKYYLDLVLVTKICINSSFDLNVSLSAPKVPLFSVCCANIFLGGSLAMGWGAHLSV